MNFTRKKFVNSVIYALVSQGISLLLSVLMSIILPKVLGTYDYSYFQLFIFYSSYSGLTLLGLNDGIYLKNGGKEWDELDKSSIGNQWRIAFIFQIIIISVALILLITNNLFSYDSNRLFVIVATLIYLLIFNTWGFFGYVFQAVNQTEHYSKSIIIDRGCFIIFLLFLIIFHNFNFKVYIILYVLSKLVSTVYILYYGRELLKVKICHLKNILVDLFDNIKIGINLTIANVASMLILGSGRMVIDNYWGVATFGKVSFSLSLSNFFLQFISQISIVLFPALRKYESSKLKNIFELINDVFFFILPLIYLSYPIIYKILLIWLPQYKDSLFYLSVLLPICLFDCKMSILYNTYFKVLRYEKVLLFVNILSVITSILLQALLLSLSYDITYFLFAMTGAIIFRSIISSIILSRKLNIDINWSIFFEIVLSLSFILLALNFKGLLLFLLILISYIIYFLFNIKYFKKMIALWREIR